MSGWQDFCTVALQIASVSGGSSPSPLVGWWQPDAHKTVWVDGTATPATPGYGEWAGPTVPDPSQDWNSLPWLDVICDNQSLAFATGFSPYDWNASPGSLSAVLYDPEVIYTPIGPPGTLDDIGIDTPVRIVARWGDPEVEVALWSGLIRLIRHQWEPDGPHMTTISASEAIEVYGRTNPVALTSMTGVQSTADRLATIHARADRPGLMPVPILEGGAAGLQLQSDDLAGNVWQELCLAMNSNGAVTVTRMEGNTPRAVGIFTEATPLDMEYAPIIGMECSPADEVPGPKNLEAGWWLPPSGGIHDSRWLPDGATPATPGYAEWVRWDALVVSPQALSVTLDIKGLANDIDLAPEGGTAVQVQDDLSIARWDRHTFSRHDLKLAGSADSVAALMLQRLAWATYYLDSLAFPVLGVRDLATFVGTQDALQAGDWMALLWDEPVFTAEALVCQVAHSIEPESWTVEVTAELQNVTTGS